MYHDMMDGWNGGYGYGFDAWGFILMLFWLVLIVLAIILLVRYLSRSSHSGRSAESATEILKRRYASGEIDKKEYQEKLKDIKD